MKTKAAVLFEAGKKLEDKLREELSKALRRSK